MVPSHKELVRDEQGDSTVAYSTELWHRCQQPTGLGGTELMPRLVIFK